MTSTQTSEGASGPWAGTRVIDFSLGLAGAYGTRVWAALGAEVIVIEPPTGSPVRRLPPFADDEHGIESSLWWAYYSAGKQSFVSAKDDPYADPAVADLLATADVVIDAAPPALLDRPVTGRSVVRTANPACTWVSITPFGLSGPQKDWKGSDLIGWASSGLASTIGFPDRPPLALAAEIQVLMHMTSMNAVIGGMLALLARNRNGVDGQLVEISIQEVGLSMAPETGMPLFLDDVVPRPRSGNRRRTNSPMGLYRCADGHVALFAIQGNHWTIVADWVREVTGNDEVVEELYTDMSQRAAHVDKLDGWIEDLTGRFTMLELFVEGQKRGLPVTPVNTVADLRKDPHLEAADWWRTETHPSLGSYTVPGSPFVTKDPWWAWSRAPLLGENDL